ncbi:MAG: hypothetical protein A3F17_03675 [Gammaproteobacteria bacterium RIFCSPHIGHO2_12_FULL_41_15]|nr:MAG: hypothetical protein A3F17_03675 [Gammaproteobacteria bacterium RIFCSPHIGHO2_12_FULL_41_15]
MGFAAAGEAASHYVVCYAKDKKTGDFSWEWARDTANDYYTIPGIWSSPYRSAQLITMITPEKINALCIQTLEKLKPDTDFVEARVATNSLSFSYPIWYENPPTQMGGAINRVVSFGDSLSDNGNIFRYSLQILPAKTGYWFGRFSNGYVWVEILANQLNVPLTNYSEGGASSKPVNAFSALNSPRENIPYVANEIDPDLVGQPMLTRDRMNVTPQIKSSSGDYPMIAPIESQVNNYLDFVNAATENHLDIDGRQTLFT